jgi:hypothetical protein
MGAATAQNRPQFFTYVLSTGLHSGMSPDALRRTVEFPLGFSRFHQGFSFARITRGDGTSQFYGFTCTLASPGTSWIGRCCESLALTCTIDRVLVPGASALITISRIVPLPLTPAVFG